MFSHLAANFLDILFPPRCIGCRVRVGSFLSNNFCQHCTAKINYLSLPVCRICGTEIYCGDGETHLCGDCLKKQPPFSLARSLVWYDEVIRELFLRLKFNADTSVIPGLFQLISCYDTTGFQQVDWIVPVPLHRRRLRKRGLNQSLILARMFFPAHRHLLRTDLLERTQNSRPQTLLSGVRRRRNLRGVFKTAKSEEIEGAVVCLVDDIFTTGTTVAECTRTMLKSGAKEVKVLTMARVKVIRRGSKMG